MSNIVDSDYMAFPLRISSEGARTSQRSGHVREQIEQVLFTNPRERVFRPEFGAGVRRLVFEPNASALRIITEKQLHSSLTEALSGEVDPKTLDVEVTGKDEKLFIRIAYTLAAIRQKEVHTFTISTEGCCDG
jgi:hypothetical protein